MEIIPVDINTITKAIEISKKENKKDLEDLLRYICGKDDGCEIIVTNDKDFYSKDLDVFTVEKLLKEIV